MRRAGRPYKLVLKFCLLVWSSGVLGTVAAMAQVETTSRISGIVTDPTGAVIPGVSVVVRNQNTGAMREATTDATGYYSVVSLLPGTYTVTVTKDGFKKAAVTGQVLDVASPVKLDFTLELGTTSQKVTVSAAGAELVTTTTSEVSGTINQTLLNEIPFKRQNFFDILVLTPGAVPATLEPVNSMSFVGTSLNQVKTGTGTGEQTQAGIFVGGNRDSGANVSIDGSNVQSSVYQQTTQLQAPASILEVKVEGGNMNAEFGSGVTAINVITKSGTNRYHGELHEFIRNNHLDAATFFTNLQGAKLPKYQQNSFGAAFGGPIKKDKLMFFANYEGMRVRESTAGYEGVPPASVFNGDFNDPSIAATIYNPFKYDPVTGLRQPFPGNKIPLGPTTLCAPRPTCVDPVSMAFLQKWVARPNAIIDGEPVVTGNIRNVLNSNQYNVRMDFLKSTTATIYGRYTHSDSPQTNLGIQSLEGLTNPYSSQNVALHWTQVLKPTLVNDFMVSYTRPGWALTRLTNNGDVAQQIGVKNTSGFPGGATFEGPYDYNLNLPSEYLLHAAENNYQAKDDLSYVRGRHTLKFGMEARQKRLYYNTSDYDTGDFEFDNVFSQACPQGNDTCASLVANPGGNMMADVLMGTTIESLLIISPVYDAYQTYYGAYAQDSWRASSKLTLNFGLRYEYWHPWLVPRNTTAQWDGKNGNIVYPLQNPLDYLDPSKCGGKCAPLNPGVPREGYKTGNLDFAPRLGLAFQVTPNTVFRAAGGIFYDGNTNTNQLQPDQASAPPFGERIDNISTSDLQVPPFFVGDMFPPPPPAGIPQPNTGASFRILPPYMPTAAVYQWSGSVQRSFSSFWTLEADYLGSHTIHEYMFMDLNSAHLPQGQYAGMSLAQRRFFPQWGRIGSWIPIGWAKYDALIVSLRDREWHGLTLISNFTWAKGLASSNMRTSDIGITDLLNPYGVSGEAQWVPEKSLITGYSYTLPFGRGKELASSVGPVMNKVVSGWTASGITTFSTGSPQPVYGRDLTGVALSRGYPDRICDPRKNFNQTRLEWFNTSCFVNAPFGTWPNAPMGSVTFPGPNNWDLTLSKITTVRFPNEGARVEFRADLFNAFNHTQWAGPSVTNSSQVFGRITNTRPARIVQFGLKFTF